MNSPTFPFWGNIFSAAMEDEAVQEKRRQDRRRLWSPAQAVIPHRIEQSDEYVITNEFMRKSECIKLNKAYAPNPAKDTYLSKHYLPDDFRFASSEQRHEYIESLKCTRLRMQSLFLLNYIKKEHATVRLLVDKYTEETHVRPGTDEALCLRELIKRKKINLAYLEAIRDSISEIICTAEEAAEYYSRCWNILLYK